MRILWATFLVVGVLAACGGRGRDDAGSTGGATGSGGREPSGGSRSGGSDGSAGAGDGSGGARGATGGSVGTGAMGSESSVGGANGDGGSDSAGGAGAGGRMNPLDRPCNSTDGSGCDEGEVCIDVESDGCWPDGETDCLGYCAAKHSPSECEGGIADCSSTPTCAVAPTACPPGYAHSIVDSCWGPCVPMDCCACTSQAECSPADYDCDLALGRCTQLSAPEPRCFMPFDAGACGAAEKAFAFVDGRCEEVVASCPPAGNDNHFQFLEECLWRCEGRPGEAECPEGRVPARICLSCGAGGGCSQEALVCAQSCEVPEDCGSWMQCVDSICQVVGCI
jgi:hypothetical protein